MNYTGQDRAEPPVPSDKRTQQVVDAAAAIQESITSMRQERDELTQNIVTAEQRLRTLADDLLNPPKMAAMRAG